MIRSKLTAVALAVVVLGGFQETEWKKFTFNDDGFSVVAPSKPQFSSKVENTRGVLIDYRTYTVQLDEESGVVVTVFDIGFDVGDRRQAMERGMQGSLDRSKATLVKKEYVTVNGKDTLQYEATSAKSRAWVRVSILDTRVYMVMTIVPRQTTVAPEAAVKITDSIRVFRPVQ